jgi:hypothetical protein
MSTLAEIITTFQIHPRYKKCFIPFDGKELGFEEYEILILRP